MIGEREIAHAEVQIGVGIKQARGATAETEATRRLRLDLHQTQRATMRGVRIVTTFDRNDGIGKPVRDAVFGSKPRNQRAESVRRLRLDEGESSVCHDGRRRTKCK